MLLCDTCEGRGDIAAQPLCPRCGSLNAAPLDNEYMACETCGGKGDQDQWYPNGRNITCPSCLGKGEVDVAPANTWMDHPVVAAAVAREEIFSALTRVLRGPTYVNPPRIEAAIEALGRMESILLTEIDRLHTALGVARSSPRPG